MATEDLIIRPAESAEAAVVTALVRQAYRGDESKTGWTTEALLLDDERIEESEVLTKISRPDGTVLLAFDGDELISCCELVHKAGGVAYFGMFAVRPALQAAGIGRRMLAEAESYAQTEWQATTMEMTVIAQRTELIDWYVRRGFVLTEETRPFPYEALVRGTALRDDLYFCVLAKDISA